MIEEGYCYHPIIYEPDRTYSMVLDKNGQPFMKEPETQPMGFILKSRRKENG